jgi:hypothetical protein
MRTSFLACVCAVSGVALVGCPGPATVDSRDAGRDARGDGGPADTGFSMRDACNVADSGCGGTTDTGIARGDGGPADAGFSMRDACNVADSGCGGTSAGDAGVDAFVAIDAFVPR